MNIRLRICDIIMHPNYKRDAELLLYKNNSRYNKQTKNVSRQTDNNDDDDDNNKQQKGLIKFIYLLSNVNDWLLKS